MKTIKKIIFFTIIYNVIFLLILNLQYTYRFGAEDESTSSFIYSSILPVFLSHIPIVCFIFSLLFSKLLLTEVLHLNSSLNSAFTLISTLIFSFLFMEIRVDDFLFSFCMVISILLTFVFLFIFYRKDEYTGR